MGHPSKTHLPVFTPHRKMSKDKAAEGTLRAQPPSKEANPDFARNLPPASPQGLSPFSYLSQPASKNKSTLATATAFKAPSLSDGLHLLWMPPLLLSTFLPHYRINHMKTQGAISVEDNTTLPANLLLKDKLGTATTFSSGQALCNGGGKKAACQKADGADF